MPRKTPVQARANETVEAIYEATIQLLLKNGLTHLTTIRIAKRAGVSVGTYYQYFPNKQALLLTLLGQHLRRVTTALELTCQDNCGKSQATMASAFVQTYMAAQLAHINEARAVYRMATNIGAGAILARERKLVVAALAAMFRTLPHLPAEDVELIAFTFFGAIAGAARAALENSYEAKSIVGLQKHLERLGQAYLASFENQTSEVGLHRNDDLFQDLVGVASAPATIGSGANQTSACFEEQAARRSL